MFTIAVVNVIHRKFVSLTLLLVVAHFNAAKELVIVFHRRANCAKVEAVPPS